MSIHLSTLRKFINEEVIRISRESRKSWLHEGGSLFAAVKAKPAEDKKEEIKQKCYDEWKRLLIELAEDLKTLSAGQEGRTELEKIEKVLAESFLEFIEDGIANGKIEVTKAQIFEAFGLKPDAKNRDFIRVDNVTNGTAIVGAFIKEFDATPERRAAEKELKDATARTAAETAAAAEKADREARNKKIKDDEDWAANGPKYTWDGRRVDGMY